MVTIQIHSLKIFFAFRVMQTFVMLFFISIEFRCIIQYAKSNFSLLTHRYVIYEAPLCKFYSANEIELFYNEYIYLRKHLFETVSVIFYSLHTNNNLFFYRNLK